MTSLARRQALRRCTCTRTALLLSQRPLTSALAVAPIGLERFGCHRATKPLNSFPQSAETVDATSFILHESEALVQVRELMLDSTSMKHYRTQTSTPVGSSAALKDAISQVVRARGKCHNPVTNSGGVLVGTLLRKGGAFRQREVPIGAHIASTSSISAIPLMLAADGIETIEGDRVVVRQPTGDGGSGSGSGGGVAVVFSCMELCEIPSDLGPALALAGIDISSLVPQVRRVLTDILLRRERSTRGARGPIVVKTLTVGCGKAGLAALFVMQDVVRDYNDAILWDEHAVEGGNVKVELQATVVDYDQAAVDAVNAMGLEGTKAVVCDARDSAALFAISGGETMDMVVNVVNVPGTETGSVLCCKPNAQATVIWFSMATRFDKAALATDAVGKDVTMLVGNGIADGQTRQTFDLLRRHGALRKYFESH